MHGAFEIRVPATSKADAVAVAAGRRKGTSAVSCYADTLEEYQRRGEATDAMFRENVRRGTE